jgi:Entner-Doudoroff aldolase
MDVVLQRICEFGVVPVVKIENAGDALSLGKALIDGDLPLVEVTFRTAAAEKSIETLTRELPDLLVGAGTVLTVDQVKKAVAAGAGFIVSPGFNPKVVDYCAKNGIPVTPGVNNPTTLEMALEAGLEVVKFFPAEASGGLKFLKAMAEPYGGVSFIPTGGVNADNLNDYLAYGRVLACGGTWIAKADTIAAGRFDEIPRLAREAVSRVLGFEFLHLGINEESEEAALSAADTLCRLFRFPVESRSSSVFAGKGIELTKKPYLGARGHIAIGTNDMDRAIAYLKRKDVSILIDTAKEHDGKLLAVYVDKEVSGFAIHLMQK